MGAMIRHNLTSCTIYIFSVSTAINIPTTCCIHEQYQHSATYNTNSLF